VPLASTLNTETTKKKAAVLDEFEQIVTAATTKLTELKDDMLMKATSELAAIGHSSTFDIEAAQEVASLSIIDQTQSAKESIAVELDLAVETLRGDAVSTEKSNIATRWNDAVAGIDTPPQSLVRMHWHK